MTSSTKFRHVDIDELDEENYRDDETDAPEGGDEGATIGQRESEVEGHLKIYLQIVVCSSWFGYDLRCHCP